MHRPVSEVADMETRLGPSGRYVDSVFQHSRRHNVGFNCDMVKAGSVGFVETAVEHVHFFFVAKKAGAQRFIIDARESNRHFLNLPSGPLLKGRGSAMSNFMERLRTLKTGLSVQPVSRTRPIKCASWMVTSVFCTLRCPRIRS